MNLLELKAMLSNLNIAIAYDHVHNKINPPFLVYRELNPTIMFADDYNYYKYPSYELELCTTKKDLVLESEVELLLLNGKIPYEKEELYDSDEKMYHIIYSI